MKRIQTLVAFAVALAFIGVTTLKSVEMGRKEGTAKVRAIHGNVEYEQNGAWVALRPNTELSPGAKIRTGPDSYADIWVNKSSTVRVTADTTLVIPEMFRTGPVMGGDTETTLDLQSGSVLGNVKKLSANSHYRIKTPHGVAGVRGTDFAVQVTALPTGGYTVTFTSVTGELVVSATVVQGEAPMVKVLRTGESWTPTTVATGVAPPDVVPTFSSFLSAAEAIIAQLPQEPPPTVVNIVPVHSNPANPNPNQSPGAPPQTFQTGGTPTGQPSSGT